MGAHRNGRSWPEAARQLSAATQQKPTFSSIGVDRLAAETIGRERPPCETGFREVMLKCISFALLRPKHGRSLEPLLSE
jgi:hypothetical protein